jgi:hypothetical protein
MNREIKFKAKALSGEWVIGNFIHSKRFEGCSNEFRIHELETGMEHDIIFDTLCQFTGIKDKGGKGVDVFEGDKIGRTSFWDKEIIWDKCGFYTISVNNPERKFPLTYLDEFDVVIGNIHDVH